MQSQTFDSFLIVSTNRSAWEAVDAWAHAMVGWTTVVVVGPSGTGKTHLAHAAAAHVRTSGATAEVMTLASWGDRYFTALRRDGAMTFLQQWTDAPDALALEHIQEWEDKDRTLDLLVRLVVNRATLGRRTLLTASVSSRQGIGCTLERLTARKDLRLAETRLPRRAEMRAFLEHLGLAADEVVQSRWMHYRNFAELLGARKQDAFIRREGLG